MMERFSTWLLKQLNDRGWTQSELARRAGLGNATLSRFISETHNPGPDACLAIAKALNEPPEKVYRLAGLLPPINDARKREIQEIAEILASLPDGPYRDQAMNAIRAIARDAYARSQESEEEANVRIIS